VGSPGRRLIVVSNRGPVAYSRDDGGERVARRGSGGLVTALRSLSSEHEVLWIASAIGDEDRAVAAEGVGEGVRLLAHDPEAYDLFYNVVANPALWFVQHGLWDEVAPPQAAARLEEGWREGYVPVNEAFAAAVCEELEADPGATVFFQDYHLYLAPRLVRECFPEALLAQFVHIPWPVAEAWNVLPEPIPSAIHDGLLANDVVGFHTPRWREHFVESAGDRAGETRVVAHPISVDPGELRGLALDPEVEDRRRRIRAHRPERLVVAVERTDPAKNVVRGLEAFGRYLDTHPEAVGRVGMLVLLDPSRLQIPEYAAYLADIVEAAAKLEDHVVVRLEDDLPGSLAAYAEYDVLLVDSLADGMNLVAKEGPLLNERDGVLVLSTGTGASEELGEWAIPVDPLDIAAQAAALDRALSMPLDERRARLRGVREHVEANDQAAWSTAFLAELDRVGGPARR
jgi:trehalose 6-phosphate synthase